MEAKFDDKSLVLRDGISLTGDVVTDHKAALMGRAGREMGIEVRTLEEKIEGREGKVRVAVGDGSQDLSGFWKRVNELGQLSKQQAEKMQFGGSLAKSKSMY